jgi:hypothetical protein
MGHPMHHEHDYPFAGPGGGDFPRAFMIPIPMAMFGVMISFMFGCTLGMIMGKKAARGYGGKWGGHGHGRCGHGGWDGRMGWKKAMMQHHHHGMGPACRCDDWWSGMKEPESEREGQGESEPMGPQ